MTALKNIYFDILFYVIYDFFFLLQENESNWDIKNHCGILDVISLNNADIYIYIYIFFFLLQDNTLLLNLEPLKERLVCWSTGRIFFVFFSIQNIKSIC